MRKVMAVVMLGLMSAVGAMAQTDPTTVGEAVTAVATSVQADVFSVIAAVAGLIAVMIALRFGLRTLRKYVSAGA